MKYPSRWVLPSMRPSGMASQGQSTHLGKAHRPCDLGFGPQRLAASCVEDEN